MAPESWRAALVCGVQAPGPRKARLGYYRWVQHDSSSPFSNLPFPWSSVKRFLFLAAEGAYTKISTLLSHRAFS